MNSRLRFLALSTATVMLACVTSCSHADRAPDAAAESMWKGEVHGHRGARARLPENTMPALEHALKAGADVLEMDLAVTRDRVLVLSHDPNINPDICTGPRANKKPLIFKMTLDEIKRYDCGAKRNPKFPDQSTIPGTRIPTLDEVLTRFAPETIRFNIETKIREDRPKDTVSPAEFARLLVETLRKHGVVQRTVVQSFDFRTLYEARKLEPQIQTSALVEGLLVNLVAIAKETDAPIISPKWQMLSAEEVRKLQGLGRRVIPWTANDEDAWRKLISYGVDGIITDDPERLINYLNRGANTSGQ